MAGPFDGVFQDFGAPAPNDIYSQGGAPSQLGGPPQAAAGGERNPIQELLAIIQGGSGAQAQAGGPQPAQQQAQASGSPAPSPTAAPSPQANILPQAVREGSFMGIFDTIAGRPSQWQVQQEQRARLGQAAKSASESQSAGYVSMLQEVDRVKGQNPDAQPHQLISMLRNSPTFQKAMMAFPADQIQPMMDKAIGALQAPKDEYKPIAPGQQMARIPGNGGRPEMVSGARNPTAEEQNRSQLMGMTPNDRNQLQAGRVADEAPKASTGSAQERAINEMVGKGELTADAGRRILSGQYSFRTVMDPATGMPSGTQVINKADPTDLSFIPVQASEKIWGKGAIPAQEGNAGAPQNPRFPQQGQQPAPGREGQVTPAGSQSRTLQRPADMVDAIGVLPTFKSLVQGTVGQAMPGIVDPQLQAKVDRLRSLREIYGSLKDGKEFSTEVKERLSTLPSPNDLFTSPAQAAQMIKSVSEKMKDIQEEAKYVAEGKNGFPTEERKRAFTTALRVDKWFRDVGPIEDYDRKIKEISTSKGVSAGDFLNAVPEVGKMKDAALGSKPTQDFSKMSGAEIRRVNPDSLSDIDFAAWKSRFEATRK